MPSAENPSIRVTLVEPALTQYRVPVFRELARRPNMNLKLFYGNAPGERNVQPDGFEAELVPMRRLKIGPRAVYWHSPQWRCATRKTTDVLCLDANLHSASLVPALLRARRGGVTTILWGHGYSKRDAAWRSLPRHRVMRLADALLFYNFGAAKRYAEMGFDPRSIFVAPNSLDQTPIQTAREHWLSAPEDLASFQREHDLEDRPTILFVSRLHADNRVDLLLEAAKQLVASHPRLRINIIGHGEPEAHRLRNLVQALDLAEHVRFLGAVYDEVQIAPWFLTANAFCYPANIGLSLLHAFGYGVPVVTSDRLEAQNPEIEALRHGENSLLYADGDVNALASTLDRLLTDRGLAQRLGQEAHRTVMQDYNIGRMVDGLEAAIRYCADARRRA